jgi:hypothetical protein
MRSLMKQNLCHHPPSGINTLAGSKTAIPTALLKTAFGGLAAADGRVAEHAAEQAADYE